MRSAAACWRTLERTRDLCNQGARSPDCDTVRVSGVTDALRGPGNEGGSCAANRARTHPGGVHEHVG
eukprot:4450983-Alexandrium_andersonii.AAC.1